MAGQVCHKCGEIIKAGQKIIYDEGRPRHYPKCPEKHAGASSILPEYLKFFEEVEHLENKLKDLPEISVLGARYQPLMLERPICMLKEILKGASPDSLWMLVDNEHINEEIGLLKKDMELLKEDLRSMRARGEKVIVYR